MAEGPVKVPIGRPGPIGRGSLMEMMKRNCKTEASNVLSRLTPTPTPSVGSSAPSLGRGRATLLETIRSSQEQQTANSTNGSTSNQSRGRAALLEMAKKMSPSPGSSSQVSAPPGFDKIPPRHLAQNASSEAASSQTNGSVTHFEPVTHSEKHGGWVQLQANYIRLNVEPGRGVYEYEVKFSPDIDSRPLRSKLLAQHSAAICQGGARVFDGTTLFLPQALAKPRTELQSNHPSDGTTIRLSIIFKKQRRLGEVVYLYNVLFRRIMHALNLVQIGRQHFNANAATAVPQHKLELWPGYVTAINEYEGGLQLCLESTHRVLRTQTVRDLIYEVAQRQGAGGRYKDTVINELLGVSVLTRYNNKVYKIDDIDWNENPLHVFSMEKDPSKKISLVQYYQTHWNITIKDKQQPLLIHRATKRHSNGEQYEDQIYLIPELCYLSGLTESMRQDYKVMKDVSSVTRITPENRASIARRFVEEIKKNETASGLLANWGLSLEDNIVALKGWKLNPESILFGEDKVVPGDKYQNADWSSLVSRMPVRDTPNLTSWCLFYCKSNYRNADDFRNTLPLVGKSMGMRISEPKSVELRDDRTETLLKMLRNNISPEIQMVVIIFPTNRNDRYAAVKKLCCVEMPIASQVILSRTLSRPDRIKSVTEKIALQINCKLGGTLWALNMPIDNCMVCGIDVHHAGATQNKHGSVAGFVASLDRPFTRWFSRVCLHRPRQELMDSLKLCFIAALRAYYKVNNRFPDRIIIYRDGVGDGQLDTVKNFEVKQLESAFSSIAPDYKPRLTVIIVQKRINTRIFRQYGRRVENAAPGTIVDHTITRRDHYDFFLVSQNVRVGTVTPTHYLVIHDRAELSGEHLQRLTFKLCHLYYNWPGTIRVPAPCKYADKLAGLVGQSIQMEPDQSLSDKLYYL